MSAQCLHTGCWIEEETELRGREVRVIATDGECKALVCPFAQMISNTVTLLGYKIKGLPSLVSQGHFAE